MATTLVLAERNNVARLSRPALGNRDDFVAEEGIPARLSNVRKIECFELCDLDEGISVNGSGLKDLELMLTALILAILGLSSLPPICLRC
jgi:hypothetical protein